MGEHNVWFYFISYVEKIRPLKLGVECLTFYEENKTVSLFCVFENFKRYLSKLCRKKNSLHRHFKTKLKSTLVRLFIYIYLFI